MNKNIKMKIFNNNLNKNYKITPLKSKSGAIGNVKYLPSFSKEWSNIIYSFNKNNLKNLPINNMNINKVIQGYFDLFFKKPHHLPFTKSVLIDKRRNFLKRIFVSDAEIKHTNNKAKITLYTINQEKKVLKERYKKLYKKISFRLFKRYITFYKNYINNIYYFLNEKYIYRNKYFFKGNFITKKEFIKYKLNYFRVFFRLNNLIIKKIWSLLINEQSKKYINLLRKYNLLYSLNQFKFNKLILLPKLNNLLTKIIGKRLEFNIINLKSITYNTDLFTKILSLKIKKTRSSPMNSMLDIIKRTHLPKVNTIKERTKLQNLDNIDPFINKYRNLKVISNINKKNSLSELFNTIFNSNQKSIINSDGNDLKKIHHLIYNAIGYKNLNGIKIEVKGRLTKRYRADRSIYSLKFKGGLKNIDSSFKGLNSISFRGNYGSNISYSLAASKRRIGAFAVKGWIGGK